MKRFYDLSAPSAALKDYNPLSRRNNMEMDLTFLEKKPINKDSLIKNQGILPRNSSREPNTTRQMSLHKNNSSNLSFLSNKENDFFLDKMKDEKQTHYDVLKAEREFFFGKLRDIDHLLDNFDKQKQIDELKVAIRNILYMTPEKFVVIKQDGTIDVEENNENILNMKDLNYKIADHYNFNHDVSMQLE